MALQRIKRHENKAVVFSQEIELQPNETLTIDFNKIFDGKYAVGVPFLNIEVQNLGDSSGQFNQNIELYFNSIGDQKQKIRKSFVFEKTDQEIYSLVLTNLSETEKAIFDLRLDNKDTTLSLLKEIRNKFLNVNPDDSGNVRVRL